MLRQLARAVTPAPVLAAYRARGMAAQAAQHALYGDYAVSLLDQLCHPRKAAVDIGGNHGAYAWHMRRLTRPVHVFEPNPVLARRLRWAFPLDRGVQVHRVALADQRGHVTLRIPLRNGRELDGLATVAPSNGLAGMPTRDVVVRQARLDDFDLGPVGLIKIDVEGHEAAVLLGALRTLRAHRPALVIEASEAHRPNALRSVCDILRPFGYCGWFMAGGRPVDVRDFDPLTHQNVADHGPLGGSGGYVVNFIFEPKTTA